MRLSIVLDTRNAPGRLREVARMCDGAGIDALWVHDHLAHADGEPRLEAWTALTLASVSTSRARLGAKLTVAFRQATTLAAMAGTLDAAAGGRLELAFSPGWIEREHRAFGFDFPDPEARATALERHVRLVRELLSGKAVASSSGLNAELGVATLQDGGPPISVEAITHSQMELAARVADDLVFPAAAVHDIGVAVDRARATCERIGRDPSTLGVALEAPVSIGRTFTEAEARAATEPMFRLVGPPAEVGVFGTLEQCQERVIELAHAGVTDLRCLLPNSPDIHDVIAQLTAIAVGTVDVLTPNAPKSKAPDPPKEWGGRRAAAGEEGA